MPRSHCPGVPDLALRSPRLPRSIQLLVAPTATLADLIRLQRGYGSLFGFLAIEYVVSRPLEVASHAMRASFSVLAALQGLWASYVHFALPPALVLFALGIVLYYAARFKGPRRIDIWTAASIMAYSWVPHLLLVAAGVSLAALGVDSALLPQYPMRGTGLAVPLLVAKAILGYGPTALLILLAMRSALRPIPNPSPPAPALVRTATAAVVALLLLSCGAASLRVANEWQNVRPVMPGDALPAFTLQGVDTPSFDSRAFEGRVLLFDFWATWCPPCVAAMPGLAKINTELEGRGLTLISVNTEPESLGEVRQFIATHALPFPVYVDNGLLQARFRVETYPTLVVVDQHGKVRNVFIGATSEKKLRIALERLLGEPQ